MSGDCNRLSFQPTITIRQSVLALQPEQNLQPLCVLYSGTNFFIKVHSWPPGDVAKLASHARRRPWPVL